MNNNKKICLVTGASSGIGFALAKALHADHYKVIATARRMDRLSQLHLDPDDLLAGDLILPDFQDSIEKYIYNKYKKCDFLFNCAGIIEAGTIEDIDIKKSHQ